MDEPQAALRKLKRGLMTGDDHVALTAYRRLYEAGAIALPLLDRELQNFPLAPLFTSSIASAFSILELQLDAPICGFVTARNN